MTSDIKVASIRDKLKIQERAYLSLTIIKTAIILITILHN